MMRRTMPFGSRMAAWCAVALLALPAAGCEVGRSGGAISGEGATPGAGIAVSSARELDGAVVRLPALADSGVTLAGGLSDDPVRRRYVLRVAGFDAHGDYDGDGAGERAVLVTANTGGSGVFVNVVAFADGPEGPRQKAVLQLGDRVHLHRFESVGDTLVVEVAEHGPLDPMCCPSSRVTRRYRIQDAAWVELPTG
jgi:hypothetical protein